MKKIHSIVISIFVIGAIIIAGLYYFGKVDHEFLIASIGAILLNIVNTATALILFDKAQNKSNTIFLLFTMGGLGARLFFVLTAILILILFLNIDKYGFILVFFVFYFCLLFVEIWYFYKQSRNIVKEN